MASPNLMTMRAAITAVYPKFNCFEGYSFDPESISSSTNVTTVGPYHDIRDNLDTESYLPTVIGPGPNVKLDFKYTKGLSVSKRNERSNKE